MMTPQSGAGDEELLRLAAAGDAMALNRLFSMHSERLRWMVQLRLNRRLQGRIDPSDVLQDAYLETCQRIKEYLAAPRMPFFLWLRQITARKLLALHRTHLGTRMREAGREVSLEADACPGVDSSVLAGQLVGKLTSPSAATIRTEARDAVQQALEKLSETDREVLVLRHFEMLSNEETAQVLDLTKTAASNRYVRALQRLTEVLEAFPGLLDQAESL